MNVSIRPYWGPNPYLPKACVVFDFELASGEETALARAATTAARLLADALGYEAPAAVAGARGSLQGAFEFLASAALFILNFVRGDLDHAGQASRHGRPLLFVEFHRPELTTQAVHLLLRLLTQPAGAARLEAAWLAELNSFWDRCKSAHPDFQSHALIGAAKARGLRYAPLGKRFWLYGMGARSKVFLETSTLEDLESSTKTHKLAGKDIFRAVGAPTPAHRLAASQDALLQAVSEIGLPCVIKPIRSHGGLGVTAPVRSSAELGFAWAEAQRFSVAGDAVMVEPYLAGRDYRLLYIRGEFVACASSSAPIVVGDGSRHIGALIETVNAGRTRSLYRSGWLRPITVDASVLAALDAQGLSLDSVPPSGRRVALRRNTNLGGGGVAERFVHVHPEVLAHADRIARHTGLHSLGIDYISTDIAASPACSGGMFTELNKYPGVPLLAASGHDMVELGSRFLGEEVGNIELVLHIVPEDALEAAQEAWHEGFVLFLPSQVVKHGRQALPFRPDGEGGAKRPHFTAALNALLADRAVHGLSIVASPGFLETHGLPSEHLSQVIADPACLSEPIKASIERLGCPLSQAGAPPR